MSQLFKEALHVVNIGSTLFADDLRHQGVPVVQVDWRPSELSPQTLTALDSLEPVKAQIAAANTAAANIINASQPFLVDMQLAIDVIPGMSATTILHAGPPTTFEAMAGPVQGAVLGALLFEGLATTLEEAQAVATSGTITFAPGNEYDAVGPMAGIISASMPMHVVENRLGGQRAYCSINEGLGKVLRFGANAPEVIERLHWLKNTFMPVFQQVLRVSGAIDLKNIINQGLQMGDECHNRNKAATSLLIRELLPHFLTVSQTDTRAMDALTFINNNDHYFLNLSMAAAKSSLDALYEIEGSSLVMTMARNGMDFGIRLAGLPKDQWFVGEAEQVNGLFFAGYSAADACRDLGDSAITETYGIGGFAMAAAPAIVNFVGGTVKDALNYSQKMFTITVSEAPMYALPALNFVGTPTGIDIIAVLESGILPVINTGIAHAQAGVGQIGAGVTHPPMACFEAAVLALVDYYQAKGLI